MALNPVFLTECLKLVGRDNLIIENQQLATYECDALVSHKQLPDAVILPDSASQIATILKLCKLYGVPVVARGAGTGLSGGARPVAGGIVLGLSKMNKILAIDPDNRTATVQPGVRNLAITEAVKSYNLYYAPDPSSQIACSIGGNVAENAGGVHCLKYGLTLHNIIGLKVVTPNGEYLNLGNKGLDHQGYDLMALLTGSEGLLGITTEITVRLLPPPPVNRLIMAAFHSIEAAGTAVASIIARGLIPAGLEMMDHAAIQATESFVQAGYPMDAQAILLCELDGLTEQVENDVRKTQLILAETHAFNVQIAQDDAHKKKLWAGRKAAFPAVGRLASDYYCMDGTIPKKQLAKVLSEISDLSRLYNLRVVNVFHAGDGNLHPLILFDASNPEETHKAHSFGHAILDLCISVGGTVTGEHGVGTEKLDPMCKQFSHLELDQFHRIKLAFDPDRLLNPGKAIPTLSRCSELGGMHIHQGQISFPELERF